MKVLAKLLMALVLSLGLTAGFVAPARAETAEPIWQWGDSFNCQTGESTVAECAYYVVIRLVGYSDANGCIVKQQAPGYCDKIASDEKTWLWKPVTTWELAQAVLRGYERVTQDPGIAGDQFASTFAQSLLADAQARVGSLFDPITHEYLGPKPVIPSATPKLSDTSPVVGQTLTAVEGTWVTGVQFVYQWFQGSAPIDGATARTFAVRPADLGKTLKVKVTGSAAGFDPATKTSAASYTVAKGKLTPTATPTVDDVTPTVDQTLTAAPHTWGPAGVQLALQWYRVSSSGRTYTITGATEAAYPVAGSYSGYRLKVKVTGRLAGYTTISHTSALTGKVAKARFATTVKPIVAVTGTPRVGKTMTVQPGTWLPGATFSYRWYRGTTAITGATKAGYTPTSSDLGKLLKVRVKGARTGYTTVTFYSVPTAKVQTGLAGVATPKLTDTTPKVDQQIGIANRVCPATAGSGATVTPSYQWYRGSTSIAGATAALFSVRPVDAGRTIKVKVTCTADDYAPVAKTSANSSTVKT